jgi:hypothetical protein
MNGKRTAERKKELAEENRRLGEMIRSEIREMAEIEKAILQGEAKKRAQPPKKRS